MALINQLQLFDKLKLYIDEKITNVSDELRALFEEFGLDDIRDTLPEIKIVADNITDVVTVAGISADVTKVAFIQLQVMKVAYIDDTIVEVAAMAADILLVADIHDEIVDVTTDPLRQSILDAEGNADRAQTEADRATAQADEIKAVGVASPVTSVPLLPGNVPGVPTVVYDQLTGLFTYGIPIGATGEPSQVIVPTGSATVAELNALGADPMAGAGYWMLDTGTVTYGDPDAVVTEVNSVLIWLADGYFFNLGVLASSTSWDQVGGVTVNGIVTTIGDDLLPTTGGTMTASLNMANTPMFMLDENGTKAISMAQTLTTGYFGLYDISGGFIGNVQSFDRTTGAATFYAIPKTDATQGSEANELTRKDYVDAAILALNPVGSVVLRMDAINPTTIYGGTWS